MQTTCFHLHSQRFAVLISEVTPPTHHQQPQDTGKGTRESRRLCGQLAHEVLHQQDTQVRAHLKLPF